MVLTTESAERERLAAVRRYDVVDIPGDGTFDRITSLAARLLRMPIAIVSIVDHDRIWFRSCHGVDATDIPRTPGLCTSAILGYEPYVVEDARLDAVALSNPLVAGDLGLRFYAAAPLTVSGGYNLGTLCVIDRQPRRLDEGELQTLADLAGLVVDELELRLAARVAVGFESDLRRQSDELAEALRASLVPPHLPRIPGLDLAVRYHPASEAHIGGDFYDVFPLPRRGWGLTMGDVCGKGPAAAAVTSAARYALRAAAVDHPAPSDALAVLNDALLIGDDDEPEVDTRFCTLVYARIRPRGSDFRVTVGCGGHPLPLVLRTDGTVHQVGAYGTLVGTLPGVTFRDASTDLRPGDTLVLYTDGLTEAKVGGGLLGHSGLARLLASCVGLSASDLVDRVVDSVLTEPFQRDDAAILAVQSTGPAH